VHGLLGGTLEVAGRVVEEVEEDAVAQAVEVLMGVLAQPSSGTMSPRSLNS